MQIWPCSALQVATDWLFSCPEAILDKLLNGSGPGTPLHQPDTPDDSPVLEPRRVALQVR